MPFDAQSARALSRRIHSVQDCLFVMKQHVVQAAQAGEYEVTVGLSESLPVVAGQSHNNAAWLVDFLARGDRAAWSEAVQHAAAAGYAVRPAWGRADRGAVLEGLTLSWHSLEVDDRPGAEHREPLLMPAAHALAMAQAEQKHVRWVEGRRATIQAAAQQGRASVSIDDALPVGSADWAKRREILHRAGFATELIAAERGSTLVVRW